MSDIADPRLPKHPPIALVDPRREPNRDVVAARRRWLRATFGPAAQKPHTARAEQARRALAAASPLEDSTLASAGYRYTKALPVLNDQLGYGEQIVETFLQEGEDGKLTLLTRTSQRTRTGRQVLFTDPPTDDDTAETEFHQSIAKQRAEAMKQREAPSKPAAAKKKPAKAKQSEKAKAQGKTTRPQAKPTKPPTKARPNPKKAKSKK